MRNWWWTRKPHANTVTWNDERYWITMKELESLRVFFEEFVSSGLDGMDEETNLWERRGHDLGGNERANPSRAFEARRRWHLESKAWIQDTKRGEEKSKTRFGLLIDSPICWNFVSIFFCFCHKSFGRFLDNNLGWWNMRLGGVFIWL